VGHISSLECDQIGKKVNHESTDWVNVSLPCFKKPYKLPIMSPSHMINDRYSSFCESSDH
jgi:hypothetical protein